jgi:hypothetical protein
MQRVTPGPTDPGWAGVNLALRMARERQSSIKKGRPERFAGSTAARSTARGSEPGAATECHSFHTEARNIAGAVSPVEAAGEAAQGGRAAQEGAGGLGHPGARVEQMPRVRVADQDLGVEPTARSMRSSNPSSTAAHRSDARTSAAQARS